MKSRLPLVLALAGVVGAGLTSMAINASADPVDAAPAEHAMPESSDNTKLTDADRAAFLEARIAALHAGLTLTPEQEKLWPPFESALRDTHKVISAQRAERRNEPRPADPVAWLQRIGTNTVARGEALKKLADAAAPLYAALNDDQKHRLPFLLHAGRFHFMCGHMFNWHDAVDHDDRDGDWHEEDEHHHGMEMDMNHHGMEMDHDQDSDGSDNEDH